MTVEKLAAAAEGLKAAGMMDAKAKAAAFADAALVCVQDLAAALEQANALAVAAVNEATALDARLERIERLNGLFVESEQAEGGEGQPPKQPKRTIQEFWTQQKDPV